MSTLTYGKGSLSVVVDDRTEELVRRAVEKVAPGAMDFIGDEARAIFQAAEAAWPVGPDKPGRPHSKDMLGYEVQIDPGGTTIRGRVYCTAAWARYIKPRGLKGKTAFAVYFRKPLRARAKVIVARLGALTAAALEG